MARSRMPLHIKWRLVWFLVANLSLALILTPYHEVVSTVFIIGTAVTATPFAIIYGFRSPWWQTPIGLAMLASSAALALLVDVTLLYRVFGDDYPLRETVLVFVLAMVFEGAAFKMAALAKERWWPRRDDRPNSLS